MTPVRAEPILNARFTNHALAEMARRGLEPSSARAVLERPEQRWTLRAGRDILQTRIAAGEPPTTYLIRVVVDVDRSPAEVVTAYRTSKMRKYWRTAP
ncbi:MAG: DUF4258 domain-containing protein [Terriglobales bacterium]